MTLTRPETPNREAAPWDDEPDVAAPAPKKTRAAAKTAKAKSAAKPKAAPKAKTTKTVAKTARAAAPAPEADADEDDAPAPRGGGRDLLIVESPGKIKSIQKFLGPRFLVRASMGHVRDIPSKGRGRAAFGIDFDNGYRPVYEPIKGREKTLRELKTAADKAKQVWLAPDPDREGEAIAWHLKEALGLSDAKTRRVTFNAITKSAVKEAMDHPSTVNMDLVNAQQGRRVLDRIVGYSLSPFLWKKVTKGLSAGRVQSVAARLVAEREEEIRAFKPEEFWRIDAQLATKANEGPFAARLVSWAGKPFALGEPQASTGESAHAIAAELEGAAFAVREIQEREVKGRPAPPFITSTLQQAASTFLHFSAQRTMRIAQQLYEGVEMPGGQTGLITYMRTDSTRIAPEALGEARRVIEDTFGPKYLPEKPQTYASRKSAQDAHEAIRPALPSLSPEEAKGYLTAEQFKLYDLVWRRFLASQMNPAIYQTTTATITAARGVLEAKGRRVVFDGHTVLGLGGQKKKKTAAADDPDAADRVAETSEGNADAAAAPEAKDDEDQLLPKLAPGDPLDLRGLDTTQHFTQPPPRYTEASLVRALEKEGIGRPSTYAPIVQTIQDRGYVRQEKRRFFATELGMAVTSILKNNFPSVMDLKFTAQMEADLDGVEEGKDDWSAIIDRFYKPFQARLDEAMVQAESLKGKPAPGGETCPLCQSSMSMRYSQRGAFLGCDKYPECKGTRPLDVEESADDENPPEPCPDCGAPMVKKMSRFGPFFACSNYPECKKTRPIGRDGQAIKLPDIKLPCEQCGKDMVAKMGRRGPFLACTGYPDCKNTKHLDKDGKVVELPDAGGAVCDKCEAPMVVRMSRRGPFLSCSKYPKCKNAKPLPKSVTDGPSRDA